MRNNVDCMTTDMKKINMDTEETKDTTKNPSCVIQWNKRHKSEEIMYSFFPISHEKC
jgi:hypothetical protein